MRIPAPTRKDLAIMLIAFCPIVYLGGWIAPKYLTPKRYDPMISTSQPAAVPNRSNTATPEQPEAQKYFEALRNGRAKCIAGRVWMIKKSGDSMSVDSTPATCKNWRSS